VSSMSSFSLKFGLSFCFTPRESLDVSRRCASPAPSDDAQGSRQINPGRRRQLTPHAVLLPRRCRCTGRAWATRPVRA